MIEEVKWEFYPREEQKEEEIDNDDSLSFE